MIPTMREASTPSRRAIRKAESTSTPVENDLQQRIQSNASLSTPSSARAHSFDTVEWWLASIYLYEKTASHRHHRPDTFLDARLPGPPRARPTVPHHEARSRTLLCET